MRLCKPHCSFYLPQNRTSEFNRKRILLVDLFHERNFLLNLFRLNHKLAAIHQMMVDHGVIFIHCGRKRTAGKVFIKLIPFQFLTAISR